MRNIPSKPKHPCLSLNTREHVQTFTSKRRLSSTHGPHARTPVPACKQADAKFKNSKQCVVCIRTSEFGLIRVWLIVKNGVFQNQINDTSSIVSRFVSSEVINRDYYHTQFEPTTLGFLLVLFLKNFSTSNDKKTNSSLIQSFCLFIDLFISFIFNRSG